MKWIREIRKVGLKNWVWFSYSLKRNEFSPKLNIINYWDGRKIDYQKLNEDRKRAHQISMELDCLSKMFKVQKLASCNCLTKTPDPQFHSFNCPYRLLCEEDLK